MSLIIRKAKLRDIDYKKNNIENCVNYSNNEEKNNLVDIEIKNGVIIDISKKINKKANEEIDAKNCLVTSPFIDPHVHLDAVLSVGSPRYNKSGTLLEGIEIWGERKQTLTKEVIKKNAYISILWYIANGCLFIRTHADTTDKKLLTVEALLELKEEVSHLADIQIVAFPQDGIFTSKENLSLMERSLEMGCDVVGGIPHNEFTREDGVKSVECIFELAKKYNKLIDIHCDETGDNQSRFVEVMAKEAINNEMFNLVTASHTTSMHNFDNDYAFKLMGIFKKTKMNFITNPFDNSVLQNRNDGYPRRRGHTRVDELIKNNINVSIGHDSIMDPWYPFGRASMLTAANLLMHTAHLSGYDDIINLFDMITINSAKTMNIENIYGIEKGKPANIIILDAKTEFDAIRLTSECLYVIRNGIVISKTAPAIREVFDDNTKNIIDFKL